MKKQYTKAQCKLCAKKRTLSPRIWSDEKLNCVEPLVRFLFIGLFSNAQDDGQICGDEEFLTQLIFYCNFDITPNIVSQWLEKLDSLNLIKLYQINNVKYIQIKNFSEYQTIRKNPAHERSCVDVGTTGKPRMNDHALGKISEPLAQKPTNKAVLSPSMNDHASAHERSCVDVKTLYIYSKAIEETNTEAIEETNTKAIDYIPSGKDIIPGSVEEKTKKPEKTNDYENENFEQVFKLYNEICVSLPKGIQLSDKRKKKTTFTQS